MKPKIKQTIIVEGKYDKIKLESIVDALIVTTDGFEIFKNKQKREFIRKMADTTGIIVFTDSDSAGFIIRNFISQGIDKSKVCHAIIPDIYGKEKRKVSPGKEGKLGVEGMSKEIVLNALRCAGAEIDGDIRNENEKKITKTDLYNYGFSGGENSTVLRQMLLKELNLPERTNVNMLCSVINKLCTYEEFEETAKRIHDGNCRKTEV